MITGRQVFGHAAFRRDNKQMAALAAGVMVPVAEQQMFKDHGLYFGLGALFIAEFVAVVVHASGENLRSKDDVLPVGRPDRAVGLSGDAGDFLCRAGWGAIRRIKAADPYLGAAFRGAYV